MTDNLSADKDALIAEQQIEIRQLKKFKEQAKADMRKINLTLVCIGGPLNDNVLGYTKEQRKILHEINGIAEGYCHD